MNSIDPKLITQFIDAVKQGLSEDIEQMLRDEPQLLHAISDEGETPLMVAVYHGKQNIVQQLLTYDYAVTLHEAVAIGDLEAVQYLVSEGQVSPMSLSYDGWTPLHLAAFFGHEDIAEYLMTQGVDVNARSDNDQNNTPIHAAAAGRKQSIVKLLLDHQADPNLKQGKGWTPLLQAVNNYDLAMCELLLDYGADVNIANDEGVTPIVHAKNQGYDDLSEQLQNLTGKQ